MANEYEIIGRLTVELGREREQHRLTLQLLAQIKSGEVGLDRVTMTQNGWKRAPVAAPVTGPTDEDTLEALDETKDS